MEIFHDFLRQLLQIKINEAEKICFAAEEAKKDLNNQLNELKESAKHEKIELEKQFAVREKDLREQMAGNEIKYQLEIKRREDEKEA